jgi:TetR/AcrR family transcriptional regulator
MARPRQLASGTRDAIFQAARLEFAAKGFAATRVEALASRAGVNKALIYYYFGSKLGLFRELIRQEMSRFVSELRVVAESDDSAEGKIGRWVATLADHLERNPSLPPILLRELADGGTHLDDDTLRQMTSILPMIAGILAQGRHEGAFGDADPITLHFMLLGSLVLVTSNAPIRKRIRELGFAQPPVDIAPFVRYLQGVTIRSLRKEPTHDEPTA